MAEVDEPKPSGEQNTAAAIPPMPDSTSLESFIPVLAAITTSADMSAKEKALLIGQIRNFAYPARWVYRLVVAFLGLISLSTVIGIIWLGACRGCENIEIPDGLIALGSASIGALAGLLANRSD